MQAELARDSRLSSGWICRKIIGLPAAIVNLLDLWPDFLEMVPDTVTTDGNYIGDGGTTFAAVVAGTLANVIVFKKTFSTGIHELVLKKIIQRPGVPPTLW